MPPLPAHPHRRAHPRIPAPRPRRHQRYRQLHIPIVRQPSLKLHPIKFAPIHRPIVLEPKPMIKKSPWPIRISKLRSSRNRQRRIAPELHPCRVSPSSRTNAKNHHANHKAKSHPHRSLTSPKLLPPPLQSPAPCRGAKKPPPSRTATPQVQRSPRRRIGNTIAPSPYSVSSSAAE